MADLAWYLTANGIKFIHRFQKCSWMWQTMYTLVWIGAKVLCSSQPYGIISILLQKTLTSCAFNTSESVSNFHFYPFFFPISPLWEFSPYDRNIVDQSIKSWLKLCSINPHCQHIRTGMSVVQTSPPSLQFICMATLVATDIIFFGTLIVLWTITWLGTAKEQNEPQMG